MADQPQDENRPDDQSAPPAAQPSEAPPAAQPSEAPPAAQFSDAPPAVLPPRQPPYPPGRGGRPETPFRRGFGLGAGAGLGVGLAIIAASLVASVVGGLVLMAFAATGATLAAGSRPEAETLSTVWGKDTATSRLRAIPVTGTIQTSGGDGLGLTEGTFGYEVADVLDSLTADDAGGVVLLMNTPGGSISGSRAMSDAVDRYRQRTGHKVFAFVEEMSASGGMYTMAGADEIVVDHGATVGSIGVVMGPLERYHNVTAAGSVLGGVVAAERIDSEYISAGAGKTAGDPYRDLTEAERAELQNIADTFYADFVDFVSTKRGIDKAVIVDQLGAGLFAPADAQRYGLIDAQMGRDEAMRHFAQVAGLDPDNTRLVQSAGSSLLSQLFGAQARPWGVSPAAQPSGGQPARASASICADATKPVALHGGLTAFCG